MIFIDSNIPMYLVGAPHANEDAARRALELCITRGERMVTSAEVMQEILHRYVAIHRLDAIQPALDALLGVVDDVFAIVAEDAKNARDVLMGRAPLSARDALHVAVTKRREVERIMSFDAGLTRSVARAGELANRSAGSLAPLALLAPREGRGVACHACTT